MSAALAMFPLGTVLLPHALIPLHVFEPRYRAMMAALDPARPEFGVVLIERGSEVGGEDVRASLGTRALVVESHQLPDGRWALVAAGTGRVRVLRWLPDDPYPIAEVEDLAEEEPAPVDEPAFRGAERAVRRALALAVEVGAQGPPATFTLSPHPERAAWQLAALVPVGPADRYRLLGAPDPSRRLEMVAAMATEAAELLALGLHGG